MRRPSVIVGLILIQSISLGAGSREARAGTIWQWTHDAQGKGTARVYDGGPAVTATGRTTFLDDDLMQFLARDDTRPGTVGGSFGVSGSSWIIPHEDRFRLRARFAAYYFADSRPSSDRPGGEGEGWLTSVVEFVTPVEELVWIADLDVRRTTGFSGTLDILVENVTKSQTIGHITGDAVFGQNLLLDAGDVVRITTESSGQGTIPPDIAFIGEYSASLLMDFIIPEPATVWLLGIAVLACRARRKEVKMD